MCVSLCVCVSLSRTRVPFYASSFPLRNTYTHIHTYIHTYIHARKCIYIYRRRVCIISLYAPFLRAAHKLHPHQSHSHLFAPIAYSHYSFPLQFHPSNQPPSFSPPPFSLSLQPLYSLSQASKNTTHSSLSPTHTPIFLHSLVSCLQASLHSLPPSHLSLLLDFEEVLSLSLAGF